MIIWESAPSCSWQYLRAGRCWAEGSASSANCLAAAAPRSTSSYPGWCRTVFFSFPLLLAKHLRFKYPYPQHGSPPVAYQGLLNLDCSPGSFSLLGACPPMHSSLYAQSWSKHKNRQRCYAHIQRDSFLLSCGSFLWSSSDSCHFTSGVAHRYFYLSLILLLLLLKWRACALAVTYSPNFSD